jgi:ATP-dependent helicase HrpB
VQHGTPEIRDADLAPLALELAAAGIHDPASLAWIDPPPTAAFAHARTLLAQLGALDADGRLTPHGQRMAELALHPRLAHMLLRAAPLGHARLACEIAALLSERDILSAAARAADADLGLRLDALHAPRHGHDGVDQAARHRVRTNAHALERQLDARLKPSPKLTRTDTSDPTASGLVLAFAYPDRIAQRRPGAVTGTSGGRFLLRNGRGAAFATPQPLSTADYLVVADTDGQPRESRIFLAAPISLADIEAHFADAITTVSHVEWDADAGGVRARTQRRLDALVLSDAPDRTADPDAIADALARGLVTGGIAALPWTDASRHVRERLQFLRLRDPSWPDVSDDALLATLHTWLVPSLVGLTTLDQVRRVDLTPLLLALLSWEQRSALDTRAPSHYVAPTGARHRIEYSDPGAPVLAIRLQELFGVAETPSVDRGAVPLTLHLLSPARRPVQVTRDLRGFWATSYFAVKKELKGRYPKHVWPDDPLAATATRFTKARAAAMRESPTVDRRRSD